MADLSLTPVGNQIKPVPQMSLADIMNVARGAQAYQQAQQMNPLQLQQQQAETALAQGTLQPKITAAEQAAKTSEIGTQSAQMDFAQKMFSGIAHGQISLINNPTVIKAEKHPESLTEADKQALLTETLNNAQATSSGMGIPKEKAAELMKPYIDKLQNDPSGYRQFLKQRLVQGLDSAADVLSPKGVAVNYGTGGQVTSTNPFGEVPVGQAVPGTQFVQGNAPAYVPGYTGIPTAQPGIGGGIQGQPGATSAVPVAAKPAGFNVPVAGASQGNAPLAPIPGETRENYQTRQAGIAALPAAAKASINASDPASASNLLYNNDKIMKLLDKPGLEIGPISDWVGKNTKNISLNPDQQLIAKYLEQRIQQRGSRSNEDQASQRTAMGSFGTDKDALREIIYSDKGQLMNQQLWSQGILNHQGNPNTPNLNSVNQFDNSYKSLSNPQLMHFMAITGNKTKAQLSDADKASLKRNFGGMSSDEFGKLLQQRDALLNLVNGK